MFLPSNMTKMTHVQTESLRRLPRRGWWLAATGLMLLIGLCFHEGLTGRASIEASGFLIRMDPIYAAVDLKAGRAPMPPESAPQLVHQPWDDLIAEAFRAGRLPLWDPHNGFGSPLLGNGQSAPFNPLKAFLWQGATGVGQAIFLVSRLMVAALGALLLARYLGMSAWAGALVGAAFALNGFFLYHFYNPETHALIALPWLLLAGERLLARPGPGAAALLGLAIGLTGMLGHPEPALYAAGAACAAVLAGVVLRGEGRGVRLAWLCAAIALGGALAAVVVLPFLELVRESHSYMFHRDQTVYMDRWNSKGQAVTFARHLLSAKAFPEPYHFNAFVGAVALALAPVGLARRGARRLPLTLLAVGALVYMLCPPANVVHLLPVAPNSFYVTGVIALGLALAAGAGLDALLSAPRGRLAAVVLALVAGLLCATALVQWRVDAFHLASGHAGWTGQYQLSLAILGAMLAVVTLQFVRAWPRPALAAGLTLLAAVHLALSARDAIPPRPHFGYPETPAIAYLSSQPGPFRIAGGFSALLHDTNAMHRLDSMEMEEAFLLRRYAEYHQAMHGLAQPEVTTDFVLHPGFQPGLLDLANVRYLLVGQNAAGARLREALDRHPGRFPVVASQPGAAVHLNRTALPRARVVYAADFFPIGDARVRLLLAAHPDRWRHRALVEMPGGQPPPGWQDGPEASSPAIVTQETPERVRISARLSRPGWLVLADAYYPGWHAYADGEAVPIYPANLAFRAVPLAPGKHEVVFRYEPRSVYTGGVVSLGALLAALLLLALRRRRPARP